MRNYKVLLLVCSLGLSSVYAQTTKSDTEYIVQGMMAMDEANVRARAIEEHFKNKNYDGAILELNKILQTRPSDSQALLFRALAYFHKKQFDAALTDLNKIKPDPTDRSMGRVYALKAKYFRKRGTATPP